MAKVRVTPEMVKQVMQSASVRDRLRSKADVMAREVESEAASAGVKGLDATVSEGTRPKGRPYARVAVPKEDEWGSQVTPKLAVLGRVAGRHNAPK